MAHGLQLQAVTQEGQNGAALHGAGASEDEEMVGMRTAEEKDGDDDAYLTRRRVEDEARGATLPKSLILDGAQFGTNHAIM